MCKYEIHEDDLQFDPLKEEYDALPQKEKDRCAGGRLRKSSLRRDAAQRMHAAPAGAGPEQRAGLGMGHCMLHMHAARLLRRPPQVHSE